MSVIYKYPILLGDNIIQVPAHSKILDIQKQHGEYQAWIMIFDKDSPLENIDIVTLGTGHVVPDNVRLVDHISTVVDGVFVWHFFTVKYDSA